MASPTCDDSNQNGITTIDLHEKIPGQETTTTKNSDPDSYFDVPPVSFWVTKDDEPEWFDRYAIIKRINSKKIGFSGPTNHQPKSFPQQRSFSVSSFIGLPMAPKNYFQGVNHWQSKVGNVYMFRNMSEHGGRKLTTKLIEPEPVSPQVSCLGMIETKKERTKKPVCSPVRKKETTKKPGIWRSISAVWRTGLKGNLLVSGSVKADTQAPALTGLNRFKSGRRLGSMRGWFAFD